MRPAAYIALAPDGCITLFGGLEGLDVLARGGQPCSAEELYAEVADLRAWAERAGYRVIVPAYDPALPDDSALDLPADEADWITWDDVDRLADDLDRAAGGT